MNAGVVESGTLFSCWDICELAAACLTLFEAPQELLSLFSCLSVSRFSINFSERFQLLLDIYVYKNIMGISQVKIHDTIW